MLDEWLAPVSVHDFVRGYFGRMPHARPGAAAHVVPWADWATLGRVLEQGPPRHARRFTTSPLFGFQPIPGDSLHTPRRWWHLVHSVEDSLSISIGVLPAELSVR